MVSHTIGRDLGIHHLHQINMISDKYFERFMICGCRQRQKQTALNLPLDWIGEALNESQRNDFRYEHKNCKSHLRYTQWKVVKFD